MSSDSPSFFLPPPSYCRSITPVLFFFLFFFSFLAVSLPLIFLPLLSICVCVGLIVPQVTYSVHISDLCRSPLLHIRLWSAGRPWAITVSLKGGWGDEGLINQSNFPSLCQRGDGSRWILSQRESIPGCATASASSLLLLPNGVSGCIYTLRQHADSDNSRASIFIRLSRIARGQSVLSLHSQRVKESR